MSGADYTSILIIATFLLALYAAGQACKKVGISGVIGEIVVGVLLGPNVANIVPFPHVFELAGVLGVTLMIFESGLHVDFHTLSQVGPRATVVAVLGTLLPLGTGIGVMNALSPEQFPIWPIGLSVGVSLAPTSVGMALTMLSEAKQLDAEFGQLIVAAAFVDDILSLVCLTMLLEIGIAQRAGQVLGAWSVLQPLVFSLLFCAVGGALAMPLERTINDGFVKRVIFGWVGAYPRAVPEVVERMRRLNEWVLSRGKRDPSDEVATGEDFAESPQMDGPAPVATAGYRRRPSVASEVRSRRNSEASFAGRSDTTGILSAAGPQRRRKGSYVHHQQPRHRHERELFLTSDNRSKLMLMFIVLLGYGALTDLIGSHLLGAFVAGMSFAFLEDGLELWHSQVKRIAHWLVRLFFGATVAFAVPVQAMLGARSFVYGLALAAGPTCLSKMVSGIPAGATDRWVVGAAMLGRGEFAFLIAQTARDTLLNPAPPSYLAAHEAGYLRKHPDGYYCLNDACPPGDLEPVSAHAIGRRLEEAAQPPHVTDGGTFCAHCPGADCDAVPREGERYWRMGPACDLHKAECDCMPMLSAEAFSITVWALVCASLLAPLLFGWLLRRRARLEEEARHAAVAHKHAHTGHAGHNGHHHPHPVDAVRSASEQQNHRTTGVSVLKDISIRIGAATARVV